MNHRLLSYDLTRYSMLLNVTACLPSYLFPNILGKIAAAASFLKLVLLVFSLISHPSSPSIVVGPLSRSFQSSSKSKVTSAVAASVVVIVALLRLLWQATARLNSQKSQPGDKVSSYCIHGYERREKITIT